MRLPSSWHEAGDTATRSSVCPVCGMYINKNQSPMALLPAKLQPTSRAYAYGWLHTGNDYPRRAVHERCFDEGCELVWQATWPDGIPEALT